MSTERKQKGKPKPKHIALKSEQPPAKLPGFLLPNRMMTRGQRLDVIEHNVAVTRFLAERETKQQEFLDADNDH